MIAVSLKVDGGVRLIKPAKLYICTQKHYKHNEDGHTAAGVSGRTSLRELECNNNSCSISNTLCIDSVRAQPPFMNTLNTGLSTDPFWGTAVFKSVRFIKNEAVLTANKATYSGFLVKFRKVFRTLVVRINVYGNCGVSIIVQPQNEAMPYRTDPVGI